MAEQDMGGIGASAGKTGFNTAKEQAKAPETEWFQAFFFAFLSVIILGAVHENSRTIAETEGHAKPAGT
ncbi:hypothetical protein [Pseudomonas fluorescens]|uniref:hypothetical protein n=1 Tax=Pseudomonas fluorescens TaxID=294 RepID=UPI0015ECBA9E|nr:hypothetical protein [Pseudomonas fluorescens]